MRFILINKYEVTTFIEGDRMSVIDIFDISIFMDIFDLFLDILLFFIINYINLSVGFTS